MMAICGIALFVVCVCVLLSLLLLLLVLMSSFWFGKENFADVVVECSTDSLFFSFCAITLFTCSFNSLTNQPNCKSAVGSSIRTAP